MLRCTAFSAALYTWTIGVQDGNSVLTFTVHAPDRDGALWGALEPHIRAAHPEQMARSRGDAWHAARALGIAYVAKRGARIGTVQGVSCG